MYFFNTHSPMLVALYRTIRACVRVLSSSLTRGMLGNTNSKMATSVGPESTDTSACNTDLLLHPELLSKEFMKLLLNEVRMPWKGFVNRCIWHTTLSLPISSSPTKQRVCIFLNHLDSIRPCFALTWFKLCIFDLSRIRKRYMREKVTVWTASQRYTSGMSSHSLNERCPTPGGAREWRRRDADTRLIISCTGGFLQALSDIYLKITPWTLGMLGIHLAARSLWKRH